MGGSSSKGPTETVKQWRHVEMPPRENFIKQLRDKTCDAGRLNILLFGPVGAGKTSFMNTVFSTFKGTVSEVGTSKANVNTTTRQFVVIPIDGANFNICDTMGTNDNQEAGARHFDLKQIMEGRVVSEYKMDPKTDIDETSGKLRKDATIKDIVHCAALCLAADDMAAIKINHAQMSAMKKLSETATEMNVPFCVILPKIDKICPMIQREGPARVYESAAVKKLVGEIADMLGIKGGMIFPMQNYNEETECREDIDALSLYACKKLLDYADGSVYRKTKT